MSEHRLLFRREHYIGPIENIISLPEGGIKHIFIRRRRNDTCHCLTITEGSDATHHIELSYFIGVDWIVESQQAIYVEPKLNSDTKYQTDYLHMLFAALKHSEVSEHTYDLFDIKWHKPTILIQQQQDLLTPLLVVQFLSIVKQIVRKGLKKSYYKIEQNLSNRVKGRIKVGTTVKNNLLKNKPLYTWCSYDEFGLNGLENRLLKKTLTFIQRYIPRHPNLQAQQYLLQTLNYITPAFHTVSEDVDINDILHAKTSAFYREYTEALRLAKVILRRFGYNISNTALDMVETPPFWIDMSKLFELYVLGLLKDRFGKAVTYHFRTNGNELDFLLNTGEFKMVIDAKYRSLYQGEGEYNLEDIRQISGYARLAEVYRNLELDEQQDQNIDCLIIYPENLKLGTSIELENERFQALGLKSTKLGTFVNFYKLPVFLPVVIHK